SVLRLDCLLEPGSGRELRDPRRGDVNALAGCRVTTLTRAAVCDAELAEAGKDDLAAALERRLNCRQGRVNGVRCVLFAQPGAICDLVHKLGLRHLHPPSRW